MQDGGHSRPAQPPIHTHHVSARCISLMHFHGFPPPLRNDMPKMRGDYDMKLLRLGPPGQEKPAILDAAGRPRDVSHYVNDFAGSVLSPEGLARLGRLDPETLPLVEGSPRIGPCVPLPLNFICIGLNYADHAAETGGKIPREPILFLKSLGAFCGPYDDVRIPPGSTSTDWEVELGIVIGSLARNVSEDDAMKHVAGYCIINDVSEREYQTKRAGTWDKGKGCDTFGPVGPWLVTQDEIPDPQNLDLWTDVDGERMQTGNTRTMIFGVRTLVSYVSQFITLHPGDLIATGTPPGVGMGKKPEPIYLRPGQTMTLGVSGLGEQRQTTYQG
ncbi:Fumarylacetoacetate hydrolase family protein [Granulibacter bethesdensis]|uniref:Fumarylacetoacetate hydrolase family protein n=2 Tax=Granulibacter bethesdensis TaxID=364410 RepID=A0AAC9K982_9PROT|nr:Fumarylacetoacetate hydrolase family protein [Granulibacter bethesdensis]